MLDDERSMSTFGAGEGELNEARISAILDRLLAPVNERIYEQSEKVKSLRNTTAAIAANAVQMSPSSNSSPPLVRPANSSSYHRVFHGSVRPVRLMGSRSTSSLGNIKEGYNVGSSPNGKPLGWERSSRLYSFDAQGPGRFGRLPTECADEAPDVFYDHHFDNRGSPKLVATSANARAENRRRRQARRRGQSNINPVLEAAGTHSSLHHHNRSFETTLCGNRQNR